MASEKMRQVNERVAAMSLRERVFILAAAVIVALALVQTLLIDAAQLRRQTADNRVQSANSELEQIRQQQELLAQHAGVDPDQALRDALAVQEARLAELNTELEARGRSLVPPERMHQILKDVVRGQGGIRIVGFKTISPQPISLQDAAEGDPPAYYRHGFEITLSGRYADLLAYLERLEALSWRLNWVEASLDAGTRPDLKLTLTIHTLSLEEAWLRV